MPHAYTSVSALQFAKVDSWIMSDALLPSSLSSSLSGSTLTPTSCKCSKKDAETWTEPVAVETMALSQYWNSQPRTFKLPLPCTRMASSVPINLIPSNEVVPSVTLKKRLSSSSSSCPQL